MKFIRKILMIILLFTLSIENVHAESTLRITKVKASFLDETVEVMRKVMEIDGSTSELIRLSVETSGGSASKTYKLVQYDGSGAKTIVSSSSPQLSFDPTDTEAGRPIYLSVISGNQQDTALLNFRINVGEVSKQIPTDISSSFGSGIVIDLSSKLPGCKLSFLPFMIPVTAKKYADGRIVVGIGYNHSDAKFWNDARKGKFPVTGDFDQLRDAVLSEEAKSFVSKPKNIGLLFSVSGWIETNVNPEQPARGKLQVYAGTGWATGGQYVFLTWDVVATIGASGAFDFEFVYNEAESKRNFQFDRVVLGAIGAVEAFGGLGLYSLAAVGIYGAASMGVNFELLPLQTIDSIILSGEVGFKVKILGKSILTFTLFSGSHDFLKNNLTSDSVSMENSGEIIRDYLLAASYGDTVGETLSSGEMTWHGQIEEESASLKSSWEGDSDFAHLLAEDIYPDSHVQIINTGSKALPQMNIVFLGSDNTRVSGNRSTLMNSYYNISTSFVSDPYTIDDDGTADYDPVVYHDDINGNTYLVWKNAQEEITDDMTLSEIADRTEISFAEFQVGSSWMWKDTLTDYAGSGICATGARVASDHNGSPVVSWYTASTDDPMALGGSHEVWLATRDDLHQWHSEKQFEVTGTVADVQNAWFRGAQSVAVTMTDESGESILSLYQNGEKIWERKNAANGQFSFMGYNYRVFVWYQEGRLYMMDENGNEQALTPEDMRIPSSDYRLYGKFGSSTVMLVGRSAADSEENAFAIFSQDGGITWNRVPLTDIDSHALVDHISVAYTNENEPIVVYSVVNYESNYDESAALASNYFDSDYQTGTFENLPTVSLTGCDPRFTDTQADLYIKARKANRHLSITDASVSDPDEIEAGGEAEVMVTLFNNGLYTIDNAYLLCDGRQVGQLKETVNPGESVQAPARIRIPANAGTEELTCQIEVTSTETLNIESRYSYTIPGGHLEASVNHLFVNMQEELSYRVVNYGYTTKEFTVVVRDEERGIELSRETCSLAGGKTYEGAAVSPSGMYVKDGCKNATIYVLFDGEEYDSSSVEPNRVKSVVPLEEIYGQPLPVLNLGNNNDAGGGSTGPHKPFTGKGRKPKHNPLYWPVEPQDEEKEKTDFTDLKAEETDDKEEDDTDTENKDDNNTGETVTIEISRPENRKDSHALLTAAVLIPLAAAGGWFLFLLAKRRGS